MARVGVRVALLAAVASAAGATVLIGQADARSFASIKKTSPPVVTGTARVGSTLTTTVGGWSWSPASLNKAKFAFSGIAAARWGTTATSSSARRSSRI